MRTPTAPTTAAPRQAALVTSMSSFGLFVAAMVAEGIHQTLLPPQLSATATAQAVLASPGSLALCIGAFMLVLVLDVVAAWGYYAYLEPVHRGLSLLAAWFRLVYTAVFALAVFQLLWGYRLLAGSVHTGVAQQAWLSFRQFEALWAMALVLFAAHLLLLGYLALRGRALPRLLGLLLGLAGLAYLADSCAQLLLPTYPLYHSYFALGVVLTAIPGEVGTAVWLLLRGGRQH